MPVTSWDILLILLRNSISLSLCILLENLELTYVPVCVPLYECMYMYLQVVVIEILTLLESFVIHRDVSIHAEAF